MTKQSDQQSYESRSAHRNIAVRHPARWLHLVELLLGPAKRLHRYRDFNRKIVEHALDDLDCRAMCR